MLITVTPATEEPVSLTEAKAHLWVIHDGDNAKITGLVSGAREEVERVTGRSLAVAGYQWTPEECSTTPLPLQPGVVTSADGELPLLFTTSPGVVPESLKSAIKLLVQAEYETADPAKSALMRERAYAIAWTQRVNIGV